MLRRIQNIIQMTQAIKGESLSYEESKQMREILMELAKIGNDLVNDIDNPLESKGILLHPNYGIGKTVFIKTPDGLKPAHVTKIFSVIDQSTIKYFYDAQHPDSPQYAASFVSEEELKENGAEMVRRSFNM